MPNQNSKLPRWTILDVLKWTTDYFASHGIDSPRLTAEILLAQTLGVNRIDLYVRFEQPLDESERERFKALVRRRVKKEPVAYILGSRDFWNIELEVTPDVLIPRPDTEILVEAAAVFLDKRSDRISRVIDLGTGSGAIIISLAANIDGPVYFACDISPAALRVASRNARKNNVFGKIGFFAGNWFEPIDPDARFDLIVSNPPYIPTDEIRRLAPEIQDHEPKVALDGSADGLRDISHLIAVSGERLVPGGVLLMEIGFDQKERVRRIAEKTGTYSGIDFLKDLGGHDRVVVLTKFAGN